MKQRPVRTSIALPRDLHRRLREAAAPKLWADSYLLAFAEQAHGTLVTFDESLARRSMNCLLLN